MKGELARFTVFLGLAAVIHLAVAWGWGRWGFREEEAEALPKLDLTSVELSLASDDAQSSQPVPMVAASERPAAPIVPDPPPPEVDMPVNRERPPMVESVPPPVKDFATAELMPVPPVVVEASRTAETEPTKPPRDDEPERESRPEVAKAAVSSAEASITETAKVEVPPSPVAAFRPKYPESCRRRGEEGIVSLDIEVDVFGHAAGVSVAVSSGFAKLDEAAVSAVRNARFTPAKSAGNPVPGRIRIPVTFRLTP